MNEENEEKSFLSKLFSWKAAGYVGRFLALTAISWVIMFPADVYADTVRAVFTHSAAGQALGINGWETFGGIFEFLGFGSDDGLLSPIFDDITNSPSSILPTDQIRDQMIGDGMNSAEQIFGGNSTGGGLQLGGGFNLTNN